MTEELRKQQIAALVREREGYEKAGKSERVAQVDEQLRQLGAQGSTPVKRAEKRPRPKGDIR